MSAAMQRLIDKDRIRDVMLRYARGVDRRDWECVRSAFFEDCHDDHADFKGTRDAFIAWVRERHDAPSLLTSTHFLGNCLVEFASDSVAAVETYFVARLELAPQASEHRSMLDAKHADSTHNSRVQVFGRYVDRFEKRHDEWRIARRRTVFDAIESHLVDAADAKLNPAWMLGRRDQHDPVFALRAEVGLN
ncbi:nuclear transport factor 2 family protein [Burkholderia multivorans]|uniref:nuclear transport factor 2 family protein n=2 Tax=Burkholderia multivorans TaxID=87883 RepID=UPI000CFFC608|nr:nuclear transport factor 2 family protein [Burkholderia multivorans]MBR7890638.1 nuclear transport factor 2 family protein [Burkholderia multivorans]MBR8021390.1 nuclear transport factor 2 family protein [Burkholderia multivorans]MBR8450728.1 nuclear transport factor 2 family protein [Burkholderia multivorans]MCL4646508.1 nuclear transport factor 2 family protein [Burkholderia multivorans]MEB2511905.1 nuclear transport factor 2 family protein [Burkholderia multivorans]